MKKAGTRKNMYEFPPKKVEMRAFSLNGENACVCQCVCVFYIYQIDDVKLAQLGRAQDSRSRGPGRHFDSGKTPNEKHRTRIYINLSYIDPETRVLNYCHKFK